MTKGTDWVTPGSNLFSVVVLLPRFVGPKHMITLVYLAIPLLALHDLLHTTCVTVSSSLPTNRAWCGPCNSRDTYRSSVALTFKEQKDKAYPTIVPMPTSVSTATPATEMKSSGADDPAAIKVAPATSSDRSNFSEMASRDGTKKSSHTMAIAAKYQVSFKLPGRPTQRHTVHGLYHSWILIF